MNSVSLVDGHIDEPRLTDEQIIEALKRCSQHYECCYCNSVEECGNKRVLTTSALDLINRLKAEIEITRNYIHDNNLEWDLLSYSKRNGGK